MISASDFVTTEQSYQLEDLLRTHLAKRVVRFVFLKKDGSIREAVGTRNPELIEYCMGYGVELKGGAERPNAFFDVNLNEWRSFTSGSVQRIESVGIKTEEGLVWD